MNLELEDRVVLVAGAGRGIGFAVARAFLREGASVVLTARSSEGVETARAALAVDGVGGRVHALAVDMTVPEDIDRALAETEAVFGPPDVVVANVGNGAARAGYVLEAVDWDRALSVNLLGGVELASRVLPGMVARRAGGMIFISSIAGVEAIGAPVTYSAAKAALNMAMKSFSRQVGHAGVRVNAVAPGNVLFPGGSWERKLVERKDFFEEYVRAEVPLQRFARPEEIADVVVFLASERASFMTGSVVVVDGGQTRGFA